MYKIENLADGLTVLKIPMDGVESVASVVMVQAGSRYESPADYGVAHFLEHMVFKGTAKYPTNKILSETLDGIGAVFNAFTSEEMTAFYIRSAARDLALGLDVLAQMVTQANLAPEEIERERGVILEEKHMYEDEPAAFNSQEFSKMFYGGGGLDHDIVGTTESIKKIEQSNFQHFINSWYQPENMLVVVAGQRAAVLAKDLNKKIEQYFQFPKFTQSVAHQQDYWADGEFNYGERLAFIDRQTEQTHFVLAWPGIDRFDDRDAVLGVLQAILGGNMSSRLFSEVRERRGLCYYVYAQTDNFCDCGSLGAASGVNPEKLTEAVRVTVEEFRALASGRKPISDDELARAKNYISGHLTLSSESVYNLALNYGTRYLFDKKIVTVAESIRRFQRVTAAEVTALARELVTRQGLRFSAIGQISDQQKADLEKIIIG